MGVAAAQAHRGFGAGDKEAAGVVKACQALEIDIAASHDIKGARFGQQLIEDVDVVQLAVVWITEGCCRAVEQVCSFIAALVARNGVQGNSERHKSIVVLSSA